MASLDEARAQFPEYRELPDAALADVLHGQFYSDLSREEFYRRIGLSAQPSGPPVYGPGDVLLQPGPATPEPAERGIIARTVEGAKAGFGDRELGISAATRNQYPGIAWLQPTVAAPADAVLRGIGAIIGGGTGALAGLAEAAGLSRADADRLERDLHILAKVAAVELPGASPAASTRGAAAERGAVAATAETSPAAVAASRPGIVPTETIASATPRPKPVGEMEALAVRAREVDALAAEPASVRLAGDIVDEAARAAIEAERLANAGPNRAGNIRLDLIHAPDDVKAVIKQTAAENADFMPARRGTITHAETQDMAGLLGMTADDLTKRTRGQAFNAEEMLAARELLVAQATKVRDLSRRAHGGSDVDKAQFAQEVTRLVAIQEQVAGATAEAGRALSQFRMLAGATKEEIARIVEASKASGIDDMARKIAELDDPAKVAAFAANAYKAKTSDILLEAWINALLSGPTTHVANVVSNALVSVWSIAENATAAAISKITGSGISGREAFARTFGILEGAKEGIVAAWRAYRTEQPSDLATKIETRTYRAIPSFNVGGVEIGGKQVRIPGRLLTAEDERFKAIGYRQEIGTLATRQAVEEGLAGRAFAERIAELKTNPTQEMREAARVAAEKQTFTNPLGAAGQGLSAIVREIPALRVVMPFIRTPINTIKFAADRSPFAPLFKEARENLSGSNGAIARDNQIARIALGSTVSAVTAYMAAEGHITGGGPRETEKRALMRADGWQPYSVKIGGTHYSYSRFEPMGMLMGVAADFVEINDAMRKDEKANVAALLMGSISRNLVSKTWMKGPADLIEAVQDPQRYGPRYIQRMVGTVVPTAIAQAAQHNDPYLREARTVLDAVRARIPGEREKLFTRRDPFGEPIQREGSLGPDLLSPIYQTAAKNDPTIAEMMRLKVTPGRLQRTIRNTELTEAEYDVYSQVAGQTMKTALDTLVSLPQWRDLPEAAQVEAFHDVIRKSHDVARTQVFSQFPDLSLRVAAETMKRKRVSPPAN